MTIGSLFHSLGAAISKLIGGHSAQIQTAIAEAQNLAGASAIVLAATGQSAAAAEVGKISSALSLASSTITAEATAETLTQHATNLANLTTALVNSGDINVKNTGTQAMIAAVAGKVQTTVGALEVAAASATPSPE